MFDYKLLEALDAVATEGGFERAARALHLTQSAISQRVHLLEEQLGQVLMVRTHPPRPTPAGERLLRHCRQVAILERDSLSELAESGRGGRVRLGANPDSLATWFLPALVPFAAEQRVLIELVLDDQDHTRSRLEQGEVIACISSADTAPAGCVAEPLGAMTYQCVATPAYVTKWFPQGFAREALAQAPAVESSPEDRLQDSFLARHFGELPRYPRHRVPSAQAYLDSIVHGLGYGLVPTQLASPFLGQGRLVELAPGETLEVPLFLHHWQLDTPLLKTLSRCVRAAAAGL
jgi:LysR family transcriptional regulator (chromosome initiation inhibitor)